MAVRRTMTMNWDALGDLDDDEDIFFDAQRLSSVSPQDLGSSSSDDEFDDSRMSFSSAADSGEFAEFQTGEYDMWMATPESITDRRKRLLEDMGLNSNKDLLGIGSPITNKSRSTPRKTEASSEEELLPVSVNSLKQDQPRGTLLRSTSDGCIDTSILDTNQRKEEMIGSIKKQSLIRTRSLTTNRTPQMESNILIKNLDNGKEFEVKECHKEGNWNKLRDVHTGQHVTMEEFEKNAGHSPKVKEIMKKVINDNDDKDASASGDRKLTAANSSFKNSFRKSKKKGAALFKNMKLGSMGASKSQKERDPKITNSPSISGNNTPALVSEAKSPSQWVKVRVHGKPYKEFTALHQSQEIKGHEGSIWSMKFTYDGHYLATAGGDKVINIWEVQECDLMSMKNVDDLSSVGSTPIHPMAMAGPDGRPPLPEATPEKKKKGKKKKGIPDYVHVPETVFGLSEIPFCTLEGHLDDILDLSWSRSRLLLSSSMDKTVRLWDIETKSCLKTFSHTDYVTCIQFNPADDDYFISGSLDSKVRIWNIPDRLVVDYIDLHEMVTSIGYSTDGKVSVVGSHKGICRFYNTAESKLEFKEQIELKTKKKPQPKKITGFHFSAWNTSEVLVTSADSRVRIIDGTKVVQKFKGYKNINSQFAADFSPDGKYVISASEDSQVYIWRHEESKSKSKRTIMKSYENFPCKEVSVTAPWPGSSKLAPPVVAMHSKKHSKRSTTKLPPSTAAFSPSPPDESGNSERSSSLPPVPKTNSSSVEGVEDTEHQSHGESGSEPCESFNTTTGSPGRLDEVTAPSPNSKSSGGHKTIQATAWGFVIVTGGLTGEIKVFQNVGLPFKVGRL